ncbi:MAG: ABC transporter ATP-binding protein [Candidatus Latescibacteria bacterium]|nr:ABC transporter ATP-binding protein [Candidatus Latescibacterota bacterium]
MINSNRDAGGASRLARLRTRFIGLGYLIGVLRRNALLASTLLVLSNLVSGFATPTIVWAMTGLVDVITESPADGWPGVLPWLAAFSAALLVRSVNTESSRYLASVIYQRVSGRIQLDVASKSVSVPLSSFESRAYYDKLETGKQATGPNLVDVLNEFGFLVSTAVSAAGLLVLFVHAHWALAVVLVVTMIANTIVGARSMSQFVSVNYKSSPQRQEIDYWAALLSSRRAAAEVRAYQLGEYLLGFWRRAFERYVTGIKDARFRLAVVQLLSACAHDVIIWMNSLALVVVASRGTISVGTLVALLYASGRFSELVRSASYSISQLVQHLMQLRHLREFLELADEGAESGIMLLPPRPLLDGIRFHGVGFRYPGSDRLVITDLNMTLSPGDRVALVGENGSGKSTIVRLLLGLYRPTQGRITVDGVDLAELDPAAWRLMATAVFQDFMRYPLTVYENIGVGRISLLKEGDRGNAVSSEIVEAARRSGAHSFVKELPLLFRTVLSKEFDGGVELSTGQWQRLAMARAYVRKNREVVVLDEPTSALDPRTEVQVYRQFGSAVEGRCTVFISHRLGSARLANRILVLKEGRLVEEGSHQALLESRGEYARMYNLQAKWYTGEDAGNVE